MALDAPVKPENRSLAEHGGDWKSFMDRYGREPLDFSASVSPLGMSRRAKRAAARSLGQAGRYPDPGCDSLREKLAEIYGIKKEWILCGNGAGDLIDRLALAVRPAAAMIMAPAYGEYRRSLERAGAVVREYPLSEKSDFRVGEDLPDQISEDLELLVLCEPNNPTGLTTRPELLKRIAEECRRKNILLLVDECFADFLDEPEKHTMLGSLCDYPVVVLRGFTKFHGMAGLRLGWCASADVELLGRMKAAGQPWPVSLPAQAAGEGAAGDLRYAKRLRRLIRAEREKLIRELKTLGCRVISGEANYLLFYDPVRGLTEGLARQGIEIRDCSGFSGLGQGWYRAAVRRPAENRRLIQAMKEVHRWETS